MTRSPACSSARCCVAYEAARKGGSATDVYRLCQRIAAVDLRIATSVLATFLGSDPILVGGTSDQCELWPGTIAEEAC